MTGNIRKAVEARIKKSQHTWGNVSRRIFRNKVINPRIEISIWNSLIRSTAIYGPHTKGLPRNLVRRLETYMYKQIRTMANPLWKEEARRPEKQLYKKIKQAKMESWLNKTQITTMLTQTQDTKTIHPKQRKGILIPRNKLHTQWEIRNHAAQEHAQQQIQEKAKKKLRNTLKRREKRNNSTGSQTSRDAK